MPAPADLSETGMANGALALVGEPPIASLDDTTRAAARACKRFFAATRDEMLAERHWQFARHSCTPAPLPDAPNRHWRFRYVMPADCVTIRTIGDGPDQTPPWESPSSGEDGTVAVLLDTNETNPIVWYTRRVVNPAQWSPLFRRLFQAALAAKVNPIVGRDKSLTASLADAARSWLDDAAVRDARARNGDQLTRNTSWVQARRGFVTIGSSGLQNPAGDGSSGSGT
jgi:hypothetical protein